MESQLLQYTAEQVKKLLNPDSAHDAAVVGEGLTLYTQNVVETSSQGDEWIQAEVYDIERHQVKLELLFPQNGRCTCGANFICRHQLALFFSHYSEIASVTEWIEEWQQSKKPSPLPIQKASEVFAKKAQEASGLAKDYFAYKEFVAHTFHEKVESELHAPAYLLDGHIQQYLQELKAKAPIESEWKMLYHFTTLFCTFLHTLPLLNSYSKNTQVVRTFYTFATDLTEELYEMVQPLSRQARPFAFDPFIEGLKADVVTLLDNHPLLTYERIDLYREIWAFLFSNSTWRKEELERVTQELNQLEQDTEERNTYTIAAIHLSVLENDDDRATAWLQELDAAACPYLFYWLQSLQQMRPLPFIEFAITHVRTFLANLEDYYERVDFVRTFTRPISQWCYKSKRLDLLEKFYRVTLPHSYWNYANFLFEQKQYKKWVEMHIYSDISIDLISTELIKEVASEEPALILPLYYHAVQEKVSLKNRSAYKQAVRYLKKMRTIYKKLKQEETFERYMNYVTSSTKRLRAFQEELKRGKLIDG
ncbi:hypothetical protein D1953_12660 [Peribacillus asahii]|uniref:SWIM-type domain-containing protein n=1 Tax=Peribacillus asahii TaxID=228899 RepID=A0A398B5A0_9BACI|nr:hypothetical protein [Peribacillus asahii]RID84997.1 hypothetical protein D1953_12660 [Peribacillus asahii]USK59633.1 hypothetical protein LIT37_21235 [Peribacillus asahii]